MKIDINKDFEEQYKSTWKGLTGNEMAIAAIALLIMGSILFAIWNYTAIPINTAAYLGIPVIIPIVVIGFYKFQGSSVSDLIRANSYLRNTQELGCDMGEFDATCIRVFTMSPKQDKAEKKG